MASIVRFRALPLGIAALSVVLAHAPLAAAQTTSSDTETALSRDEFHAGLEAARRGDWVAAREAFARSYRLYPRALTLFDLAGAQAESGQLVAGTESYRRFLAGPLEGPAAAHRQEAIDALARLAPRIAHARITAPDLAPGDRVALDGRALPPDALGARLPVDPGAHRAELVRAAAPTVAFAFELAPGESREITLRAARPPAPPAAPSPNTLGVRRRTERPPAPPTPGRSWVSSPWLWTAVGVIVVGAAVTTTVLVLDGAPAARHQGSFDPGALDI